MTLLIAFQRMIIAPVILTVVLHGAYRPVVATVLNTSSTFSPSLNTTDSSPSVQRITLNDAKDISSAHSPSTSSLFASHPKSYSKMGFAPRIKVSHEKVISSGSAPKAYLCPTEMSTSTEKVAEIAKRSTPRLVNNQLAEQMIKNQIPSSELLYDLENSHNQMIHKKGLASTTDLKSESSKYDNVSIKRVLPLVYMSKDGEKYEKSSEKLVTGKNKNATRRRGKDEVDSDELHQYRTHRRNTHLFHLKERQLEDELLSTPSSTTISSPISKNKAIFSSQAADHYIQHQRRNQLYQPPDRSNYFYTTESSSFPPSLSQSMLSQPLNSSEIDRLVDRLRVQLRPHRYSPLSSAPSATLSLPGSRVHESLHLPSGSNIFSAASMAQNRYRHMSSNDMLKDVSDSLVDNDQNPRIEATTMNYDGNEDRPQDSAASYLTGSEQQGSDLSSLDFSNAFYPHSDQLNNGEFSAPQILPTSATESEYGKLQGNMLLLSPNPTSAEHLGVYSASPEHQIGSNHGYKNPHEYIHNYYEDAVKNGNQFQIGIKPNGQGNYYNDYATEIRPSAYGGQNTMRDVMRMIDSVKHVVYKIKPLKGIASKMYRDFTNKMKTRIKSFRGPSTDNIVLHSNGYGNNGLNPVSYASLSDASSIKPNSATLSASNEDSASSLLNEYIQQIAGNSVNGLQPQPSNILTSLSLAGNGAAGLNNLPMNALYGNGGHFNSLSGLGGMNNGLASLTGLSSLMRPQVGGGLGGEDELDESSLIFQLLSGLKLRRAGGDKPKSLSDEPAEGDFSQAPNRYNLDNLSTSKAFLNVTPSPQASTSTPPVSSSSTPSNTTTNLFSKYKLKPSKDGNKTYILSSALSEPNSLPNLLQHSLAKLNVTLSGHGISNFTYFMANLLNKPGLSNSSSSSTSRGNEMKAKIKIESRSDQKKGRIKREAPLANRPVVKREALVFGSRLNRPKKVASIDGLKQFEKTAKSRHILTEPVSTLSPSSASPDFWSSQDLSFSQTSHPMRPVISNNRDIISKFVSMVSKPLRGNSSKDTKSKKYLRVSNNRDIEKLYQRFLNNSLTFKKPLSGPEQERSVKKVKWPGMNGFVKDLLASPSTTQSTAFSSLMHREPWPSSKSLEKVKNGKSIPMIGVFVAGLNEKENKNEQDFSTTEDYEEQETATTKRPKVFLHVMKIPTNSKFTDSNDGVAGFFDIEEGSDLKKIRPKLKPLGYNKKVIRQREPSYPEPNDILSSNSNTANRYTLSLTNPQIMNEKKKKRLHFNLPPPITSQSETEALGPKSYILVMLDFAPNSPVLSSESNRVEENGPFSQVTSTPISLRSKPLHHPKIIHPHHWDHMPSNRYNGQVFRQNYHLKKPAPNYQRQRPVVPQLNLHRYAGLKSSSNMNLTVPLRINRPLLTNQKLPRFEIPRGQNMLMPQPNRFYNQREISGEKTGYHGHNLAAVMRSSGPWMPRKS